MPIWENTIQWCQITQVPRFTNVSDVEPMFLRCSFSSGVNQKHSEIGRFCKHCIVDRANCAVSGAVFSRMSVQKIQQILGYKNGVLVERKTAVLLPLHYPEWRIHHRRFCMAHYDEPARGPYGECPCHASQTARNKETPASQSKQGHCHKRCPQYTCIMTTKK